MGDWYCFDAKEIDEEIVYGFTYQNENSGWNPIFVEFTGNQAEIAETLEQHKQNIENRIEDTIKGWLNKKED